jgi:hypothetical protein
MTEPCPFAVLELPLGATAREIERAATKLLGMLELGLAEAAAYPGPDGPRPRTPEAVRAAAATLRDPRRRLTAEVLAATGAVAPPTAPAAPAAWTWPEALGRLGWGPR